MNASDQIYNLLSDLGLIKAIPEPCQRSDFEGPIRTVARLALIDEPTAMKAVAIKLHLEVADLSSEEMTSRLTPQAFGNKLDPDILWKYKIYPLYEDGAVVAAAIANPFQREGISHLEQQLHQHVKLFIAEEHRITQLLLEHFPNTSKTSSNTGTAENGNQIELIGTGLDEEIEASNAEAKPVVDFCNRALAEGLRTGASDIHFEPAQHGLEVRLRIDGIMETIFAIPKQYQLHVISRLKILCGMDIAERRRPQDGRLRARVGAETVDFRVSSLPTAYGEKVVLRILRAESISLNFPALGFPPDIEARIVRVLTSPGRMFLVTGPTGSGKTTTLYTCLTFLRDGTSNIQTVEDPIEYRLRGINQVQVNAGIDVTFASALRSILRQDPDVIMIGEIRDHETAEIAVQSAQTGHLVLSTLHTNDAPGAISRLLNLGINAEGLASSLAGILTQRLVRKVCSSCSRPYSPEELKHLKANFDAWHITEASARVGAGCEKCAGTGYKGRVGIFSYLDFTSTVADAVARGAPLSEVEELASLDGFRTLDEASAKAVSEGVTSFEEVQTFLRDPRVKKVTKKQIEHRGLAKDTILLVEDDPDTRSVLSMVLRKEMFEVVEAANGEEALKVLYEQPPTLILCDLMMPVMDGRELLKRVRANRQMNEIPVLILTAVDTDQNQIDLLDLGAKDFVSKASSARVLLSRVRRALT